MFYSPIYPQRQTPYRRPARPVTHVSTDTRPASAPQIDYLTKLIASRDLSDVPEFVTKAADRITAGETITRADASPVIDILKVAPYKARPVAKVALANNDVFLINGRIVKVKKSQTNGRFYTVTWNGETAEWDYTNNEFLDILSEDNRLTIAMAVEYAGVTGRCIRCGIKLKAKKSVIQSIGPVCIKHFAH